MRKQRSLSLVLSNIWRTRWRKTRTHSRALQMHKMLTHMDQKFLDAYCTHAQQIYKNHIKNSERLTSLNALDYI